MPSSQESNVLQGPMEQASCDFQPHFFGVGAEKKKMAEIANGWGNT